MSGFNEYSDLFESEGTGHQSGSGLRQQLEQLLQENKKLMERLEAKERTEAITSLLTEKGKDPAAAVLVPKDADPKAWLEANAAFLADAKKVEEAPPAKEQEEQPPAGAPEVLDPALEEERAAMETITGLVGTGIPSTASADPIQRIKATNSEEELLNLINAEKAAGR